MTLTARKSAMILTEEEEEKEKEKEKEGGKQERAE